MESDWLLNFQERYVKVKFGDQTAQHVIDGKIVAAVDTKLNSLLLQKTGNGFAGSLAVSILRSDIDLLKKEDYSGILLKSDGIRYWMFSFFLQDPNSNQELPCVDFIDRSFTHFLSSIPLPSRTYHGTIFDGELVKTKEEFVFQIFDCVVYAGKNVGFQTHPERLKYAKDIFCNGSYVYNTTKHPFRITVKDYCSPEIALNCLKNNPFPLDGWILIDVNRPYISGKDPRLFKFKENHTIDLKVTENNGCYHLCVIENGALNSVATFALNIEEREKLQVGNESMLCGKILECKWEDEKWKPIMVRWDKDIPNNRSTYELTLQNIKEMITAEEMFDIMNKN